MIKYFEKFNGINIIDMFSVMFSGSVIRNAARNNTSNGTHNILAKKNCSKDIDIKGLYIYGYLKCNNPGTSIVFLYGKNNDNKLLYREIYDTCTGDAILYLYPDAIENCEDFDWIPNTLIHHLQKVFGHQYAFEILFGLICSNPKIFKRYYDKWKTDLFYHSTSLALDNDDDTTILENLKNSISIAKKEFDDMIDLYKETQSASEVVREINYGDHNYKTLINGCS